MLKKTKRDGELEREWLLLGEPPQSPRVATVAEPDAESSILSDPPISDVDCIAKENGSDSESTTDIDAIVDEYRQKVKVSVDANNRFGIYAYNNIYSNSIFQLPKSARSLQYS